MSARNASREYDAVAERVSRLERLFEAFARQRQPDDEDDQALLLALLALLGPGDFVAPDMIERADVEFKTLLAAVGIYTAGDAAYWLRRMAGRWVAGHELTRLGRTASGRRWAFVRC